MTMILYYCDSSYASHKVMLYLCQKHVVVEKVHLDLRRQEHIWSDYRHINPNGQVPALKITDRDLVVVGSTDIMLYVNDHCLPQSQRLPEIMRDKVIEFCRAHERLHDPYVRTLSYHLLFMQRVLTAEKKAHLLEAARNHPDKARGLFLEQAVEQRLDPVLIEQAYQEIERALEQLAALLANNPNNSDQPRYVFDDQFTMADAVALAGLYRFEKLAIKLNAPILENYYRIYQDQHVLTKAGIQ